MIKNDKNEKNEIKLKTVARKFMYLIILIN